MRRAQLSSCPAEHTALQNPDFLLKARKIPRLEGHGCIFPRFPIVQVMAFSSHPQRRAVLNAYQQRKKKSSIATLTPKSTPLSNLYSGSSLSTYNQGNADSS